MDGKDQVFCAYEVSKHPGMPLATAPHDREWMDESPQRFAYRCLPLVIANQAGWVIPNPVTFTARWDGGLLRDNVQITFDAAPGDPWVSSHFGCGTITFSLPYLFRTPGAVNLWVKGLSNWIKDGVQPLEGIIETSWLPATFTMNWKLTRPDYPVRFERGEPICMVVPVARGLAESLTPLYRPLEEDRELHQQYEEWARSRGAFLTALAQGRPEAVSRGWQRDYTKGLMPGGARAAGHQTRLELKEFTRPATSDLSANPRAA